MLEAQTFWVAFVVVLIALMYQSYRVDVLKREIARVEYDYLKAAGNLARQVDRLEAAVISNELLMTDEMQKRLLAEVDRISGRSAGAVQ